MIKRILKKEIEFRHAGQFAGKRGKLEYKILLKFIEKL
jgi:hypothetical protein